MCDSKTIRMKSDLAENLHVIKKVKSGNTEDEIIRVAAYCRVSTDLESQESSFKIQMDTFEYEIKRHPGWKLAGIFSDKGLSGTSAKKRTGFQDMIKAAENGEIDYIITKSISRFSRNTLEFVEYVRYLKDIGVGVYFEEQNLDTLSGIAEVIITLHAAFAQEESRSLSENIKVSRRARYKMGKPDWVKLFGYKLDKEGKWIVQEEEASVVKKMYTYYIGGMTLPEIARAFEKDGIKTARGGKWTPTVISEILKNIKYTGNVVMQKYYCESFMNKKLHRNIDNKVPVYYKENHHQPIVTMEEFKLANTILTMKDNHRGSQQYPYYGVLVCPICGERMISASREWNHPHFRGWTCAGKTGKIKRANRTSCPPYMVPGKVIDRAFFEALDKLPEGRVKNTYAESVYRNHEGKRVEYIYIMELLDKITVENINGEVHFDTLLFYWKWGEKTAIKVTYDGPTQIPVLKPELIDNTYYADGKIACRKGGSSANVFRGVNIANDFCQRLLIFDEPKTPIVPEVPSLGYVDIPTVIPPSTIKKEVKVNE